MPRYEITVSEVRDYKRTYTVEADSPEEATEKAERGETVDEAEGILNEIVNREALSTPKLIN
jgi:hypothetical protein